jgi:hypothetical protein
MWTSSLVGDAHQHLPLLHRPEEQPVADLPGDHHAVERAGNVEIAPPRLPQQPLGLEALDLPLELGRPARQPHLLVGRDLLVLEQRPPRGPQLLLARGLAAEHVGQRHVDFRVAEPGQRLAGLDRRAVLHARGDRLDYPVDPGEYVAAMDRLERPLALES